MAEFNIFKVSHGKDYFSVADHQLMLNEHLVSVHPDTKAMATSSVTQYHHFITAKKGDVFFICRSNESVDVIGMFKDERPLHSLIESHYEDWIDREFITLYEFVDNDNYDKSKDKWWLPGNLSTCNPVKSNELNLFEEKILKPAFGKTIEELVNRRNEELKKLEISMDDIVGLQSKFDVLFKNDSNIFDIVNNLSKIEKLKILNEYSNKGNIENQPVVLLRKKLIDYLVEKEEALTKEAVDALKIKVAEKFEKNVFQAWSSYFRILYPFFYAQYKTDVVKYVENLVENIRQDLGIHNFTKKNIVHFDGAQNQGFNRVWFAIYNSSHKNQKSAKQLFFSIENNGIKYGLLSLKNPNINQLITTDLFNYQDLIDEFRLHVDAIKNDDVTKFKRMNDLRELLEYKKQLILQGPPGTGKTYTAKDLAEFILTEEIDSNKKNQAVTLKNLDQFEIIQFHPAYTYEDFIRGIVTEPHGDKIQYVAKDKMFLELVHKAYNDPEGKPYVLIIDEINRANLSAVLGELIYALEYRDESFKSMYADQEGNFDITIPGNLYIIGTLNTADRSVGHMDYALRRRFAFYDILPKVCEDVTFDKGLFTKVSALFVKEIKANVDELEASHHLSMEFQDRPQDIWLGHSYFFRKEGSDFSLRIQYEILPILQEYVKDGILNNTDEVKSILKEIANYQIEDANS